MEYVLLIYTSEADGKKMSAAQHGDENEHHQQNEGEVQAHRYAPHFKGFNRACGGRLMTRMT